MVDEGGANRSTGEKRNGQEQLHDERPKRVGRGGGLGRKRGRDKAGGGWETEAFVREGTYLG